MTQPSARTALLRWLWMPGSPGACQHENSPPSPGPGATISRCRLPLPTEAITLGRLVLAFRRGLPRPRGAAHQVRGRGPHQLPAAQPVVPLPATPPPHGDRWQPDEPDVKVAGRWRQVTERSTRSGRGSTWWSLGSETPTPARRLVQHHQGHAQPGHAQPRSPPARRRSTPPCWRRCCQRRGSAATAPPAPRRGRPRQGAGAAAPDARAQAGPQRPGRHRRAGVRPKPSTPTRRAGHGRADQSEGRVRRTCLGHLRSGPLPRPQHPPVGPTQQCPVNCSTASRRRGPKVRQERGRAAWINRAKRTTRCGRPPRAP